MSMTLDEIKAAARAAAAEMPDGPHTQPHLLAIARVHIDRGRGPVRRVLLPIISRLGTQAPWWGRDGQRWCPTHNGYDMGGDDPRFKPDTVEARKHYLRAPTLRLLYLVCAMEFADLGLEWSAAEAWDSANHHQVVAGEVSGYQLSDP